MPFGVFAGRHYFPFREGSGSAAKKKSAFSASHSLIRIFVLLIAVLFLAAGSLFLINVLDPFSLFGRFATHLLKPVYYFFNNILLNILEAFDLYYLSAQKFPLIAWPVYLFISFSFLAIFLIAFRHGRLYCNTLCPVGTVLGFCSRYSHFKIRIDPETCTGCGRCEKRCKAHCLAADRHFVDQDRCVACFDCVGVCPTNAITYAAAKKSVKNPDPNPVKRKMLFQSLTAVGLLVLASFPGQKILTPLIRKKKTPITPPGSLSVDHFVQSCIGCHLCVDVCYSRVLQPAFLDYGWQGMLQPVMDFSRGKCAYDCNLCTRACPSGAILPLGLKEKQTVQIGKVAFEKEKCIVYAYKRDCGACAEVCPTHAVYTETRDNIRYPAFKPESCTGCGACENVCPVYPKAIWVEGHRVHQKAAPPFMDAQGKGKAAEKAKDKDEEFPF